MGRPPKAEKGIKDWDAKQVAMRLAIGQDTNPGLIASVLDEVEGSPRYESVLSSWNSWAHSDPDGPVGRHFFSRVAEKIGFRCRVSVHDIVRSTLAEFLDLLELEKRTQVVADSRFRPFADRSGSIAREHNLAKTGQRIFNYVVDTHAHEQTIRDGLRQGRIDQKYHYQSQETALRWSDVINAEDNSSFDDCKAALRLVFKNWPASISLLSISAVVSLGGGGAVSKDKVVLNALMEARDGDGSKLRYCILDISSHMINSTMPALASHLVKKGWHARVDTDPVVGDILSLSDYGMHFQSGRGRRLFLLTGGTLGNLNEEAVFTSLGASSSPGDLLLLGADTFKKARVEDEKCRLREKYSSPKMKAFFMPAFQAALCVMNMPFDPTRQADAMQVDVAEGRAGGHSSLEGSLSPHLWFERSDGQPVVLVSSTRYDLKSLVAFAEQFGWKLAKKLASPSNTSYFQFLFEREGNTK